MKQANELRKGGRHWLRRSALVVCTAMVALSCGCKKSSQQEVLGPKNFASPESAGQALLLAVKAGDDNAILAIFGPAAKDYLFTGDAAQDRDAFDRFAAEYENMHRWSKLENGGLSLNVGAENYPFPFPLEENSDGQWSFNGEAGQKEFLARQIGKNELKVIDVLNQIADAQEEYFNTPRDGAKVKQYAQRFLSSEGKHDGLYWKVAEGEAESPLGPLVASAAEEGYTTESRQPFHGYYYRILKEQGAHAEGGAKSYLVNGNMTRGFAILAWPAEYRKSGVMSFIIDKDRFVYQADLGTQTADTAKNMKVFDPDEKWSVVE